MILDYHLSNKSLCNFVLNKVKKIVGLFRKFQEFTHDRIYLQPS